MFSYSDIKKFITVEDLAFARGAYSAVHKGRVRGVDQKIAISEKQTYGLFDRYQPSTYLLSQAGISSPFIQQAIFEDAFKEDAVKEDQINPHLITWLAHGDLSHLPPNIPSWQMREIFGMILLAINDLHQCGIVHWDLKPTNFLFYITKNGEYHVECIDLDLTFAPAKYKSFLEGRWLMLGLYHCYGTITYCAPELLSFWETDFDSQPLAKACPAMDCYALGKTFQDLINSKCPDLKDDNDCIDLIRGLMDPKPEKRLTVQQAMAHPFFKVQRENPQVHIVKTPEELTEDTEGTAKTRLPILPLPSQLPQENRDFFNYINQKGLANRLRYMKFKDEEKKGDYHLAYGAHPGSGFCFYDQREDRELILIMENLKNKIEHVEQLSKKVYEIEKTDFQLIIKITAKDALDLKENLRSRGKEIDAKLANEGLELISECKKFISRAIKVKLEKFKAFTSSLKNKSKDQFSNEDFLKLSAALEEIRALEQFYKTQLLDNLFEKRAPKVEKKFLEYEQAAQNLLDIMQREKRPLTPSESSGKEEMCATTPLIPSTSHQAAPQNSRRISSLLSYFGFASGSGREIKEKADQSQKTEDTKLVCNPDRLQREYLSPSFILQTGK